MSAAVQLHSKSLETAERLTCSNNPLDFNAGSVQLLGKLMDSPVWVFIGFRVNVGFGAWEFNCGETGELNMHTAELPIDRQTLTEQCDKKGPGLDKAARFPGHLCQVVVLYLLLQHLRM